MGGFIKFFSSPRSAWMFLAGALALFPSCQGPGKGRDFWTGQGGEKGHWSQAPDLTRLESPGRPTNWKELEKLGQEAPSYETRLRRAFLYLRVRRPDRAKEELDLALLIPGLSKEQEAVAWYGKALAFSALELPGRARWSLEQARKQTMDPTLLARLRSFQEDGAQGKKGRSRKKNARTTPASLRIHTRREWGARPTDLAKVRPMGRAFRITIHHSGFPCSDPSWSGVRTQIRAIQRNHKHKFTNGEGWADVGYHFFVDPSGGIWEGRSLRYQGAHAGNHALNKGNIGICLLGDFQDHAPPAAQMKGLERLLRYLMKRYKIPATRIYTHRELKSTACPGRWAQKAINRLRRKLSLDS